ncbi:MAG: transposase [Bdellovibrionales bacterium]
MSRHLYFMHWAYSVKIHSFVLMRNHFHLLITTPANNLSAAMGYFMRETSRAITKSADRINQTYGQRHHRTIVNSNHYYLLCYKYVYRNPVVAGLIERPEDYPFSTLHRLIGRDHLLFPVAEDITLFSDFEGTLSWLNRPSTPEAWQAVKMALRRRTFSLAKDQNTKRPNALEIDTL